MNDQHMNIFSPSAIRKGPDIDSRFKAQAEKAYEKYRTKIEAIEDARRKKEFARQQMEEMETDYSDALGMYMIDDRKGKEDDEKSESSTHISSVLEPDKTFCQHIKDCIAKINACVQYEISWKEFMCITFCLQVHVMYLMKHIAMLAKYGALLMLFVYMLVGFCIAMPVYMVLMFMGNYGRRSYIRFWECVPIMKGVAYSVALVSMMVEHHSVSLQGLCLTYVFDLCKNGITWTECQHPSANHRCVPMSTKVVYDENCCNPRIDSNCTKEMINEMKAKFSTYDYLITNKLQQTFEHLTDRPPINPAWSTSVAFVWVLLFITLVVGLHRLKRIITFINILIFGFIVVPLLILTLIISPRFSMLPALESRFATLFDPEFWLETSIHSLHRELAGDVITFSAISSPGISTTVDSICIYSMKVLFLVLFTVWLSISVTTVLQYYRIKNPNCLEINGLMLIFGVFPDIISRYGLPRVGLILYFLLIFFWLFTGSVYTLKSLIDAVLEEFPRLRKMKILFCVVFCAGNFTGNIIKLKQSAHDHVGSMAASQFDQVKITLLFCTLIGFFLYTIKRLANDYHFIHGKKLKPIWLHGLKLAMLLVTILGVSVMVHFTMMRELSNVIEQFALLAPIFLGAIVVTIQYQARRRTTLIDPDPKWGPPDEKTKIARNLFDPKRDLRYRSSIQKCKHVCLLNSTTLENEVKYWNNKRTAMYNLKSE